MSDTVEQSSDIASEDAESADIDNMNYCRACLKKCGQVNSLCNIFQAWSPPWDGMEATIAEDLSKLANIEIMESELQPSAICHPCYQKLLTAATFVSQVKICNTILKLRMSEVTDGTGNKDDFKNDWPKPIQIDKNVNGSVYENSMDIDIKQEVLSDEEYRNESAAYMESELGVLDIKAEPEDIEEPPPMQITINGTMSLDPKTNNSMLNGIVEKGEQHLEVIVKQEPVSDEEDTEFVLPDLPLDCMLCTKSFNKVSGLKAHVISQHSYKSVKRKLNNMPSPEKRHTEKHVCEICKRSFTTSTDLMVHETCHNKYSCYVCGAKFDTFELLTKHRRRCKSSDESVVKRPKTLDDVMRPQLENSKENSPTPDLIPSESVIDNDIKSEPDALDCASTTENPENCELDSSSVLNSVTEISQENLDNGEVTNNSMELHLEIHSAKEAASLELHNVDMQVESLCNDQ